MRVLLDRAGIDQALATLLDRILDGTGGDVRLVGIQRGGVPLANRLADALEARTGRRPQVGSLDITLYRDDLGAHPAPLVGPTRIDFPLEGKQVVLVDDVLSTGRTVRAALDEITDFGRPGRIWLAVLVDRQGRELPIQADFVGAHFEAGPGESIEVALREAGGDDQVVLVSRQK